MLVPPRNRLLQDALLLVAVIAVALAYVLLNHATPDLHVVRTPIDDAIPRIAVFAIPYLAFLPFFWITVIWAWRYNRSFRPLAVTVIAVHLVAYVVYVSWQTYVERAPIDQSEAFANWLQFVYAQDQPYNGLPSLHAALSTVIATFFFLRRSRWAWLVAMTTAVIVASTLFVKQHYVADAVSGFILGAVATVLAFRWVGDWRRT